MFDSLLIKEHFQRFLLQLMYQRQTIPAFGKLYILTSIVLSLLVFTKSINPYSITYSFTQTFLQFQLWRPFTAILYLSRLSILLPIHLAFAYLSLSKWKQKLAQKQQQAAIIWLFLLSAIFLATFSTFAGLYFYGNSFIMIFLMMWAVQFPHDFYPILGIHLNSIYFPVLYSGLMILLGSSFKNYLAGFLIGMLLGITKSPSFIQKNGNFFPIPNFIKSAFPTPTMGQVIQPASVNEVFFSQRRGDYFTGLGVQIG